MTWTWYREILWAQAASLCVLRLVVAVSIWLSGPTPNGLCMLSQASASPFHREMTINKSGSLPAQPIECEWATASKVGLKTGTEAYSDNPGA